MAGTTFCRELERMVWFGGEAPCCGGACCLRIPVSNSLIPPLPHCRMAQLLKQDPAHLTDGERIGLG